MPQNSFSISRLNEELQAMGLSLTNEEEFALAQAVGEAWDASRHGSTVSLESLLVNHPSLISQAQALLANLKELDLSATSLTAMSQLASTVISSDSEPHSASPEPADRPNPFPGEYQFKKVLAQGTFGKVWLAHDIHKDVPVAIKTIRLSDEVSKKTVMETLSQDAKMPAIVRHNHIVQVHALRFDSDDNPYVIMEHVAGGSLLDRLRQRGEPFEWSDACQWIADVGDALAEIHAFGILHRDIKPANILFDDVRQEARLGDFGLAARRAELVGGGCTPAYSPPEAWESQFSEASDLYGLAATLFHLITNQLLSFPDEHRAGLPNPEPRLNHVPRWLEDLLRQALAPKPEDRSTLTQFLITLRSRLNQCLLDKAQTPQADDPIDLRMQAFLEIGPVYVPIKNTIQRMIQYRDVNHNPPPACKLRNGNRFRIQIRANQPGHLLVFNIGTSGNIQILHPDATTKNPNRPDIEPGRPWNLDDLEISGPPGTERIAAIWGSRPLHDLWSEQQLKSFLDPDQTSYDSTRGLRSVQEILQAMNSVFRLTILELDHVVN